MPSDMYSSIGGNVPHNNQNPREQALNLMRQQGIQVPQGMENNPNAILQHLMQSGRIPQNRLSMAQRIMQNMFRR